MDGWADGSGSANPSWGFYRSAIFFEPWETLNPCCVCATHLIGFCRMLIYGTC